MSKVLILIDCQNDFIDGGRLAVGGSKAKMIALSEYINKHTNTTINIDETNLLRKSINT